jgi:hypothetical protein
MAVEEQGKKLTQFLRAEGVASVPHNGTTYLAHLTGVSRLMRAEGCAEELCRAGLFHSIYGTEMFQSFRLSLERREEIAALIGARAERLAYLNCALLRANFDYALEEQCASATGLSRRRLARQRWLTRLLRLAALDPHEAVHPVLIKDRISDTEVALSPDDFDDLCRVHLFDWLEQVPRLQDWNYRRVAFRRMAERLGSTVVAAYDRVFVPAFESPAFLAQAATQP